MFYQQGSVTGNLGFVFMNPVTQAPYSMRQPSMKLMLKRLCEKAGVTPFGFHAIRHYFAVSLVKSQKADIMTYSSFWATRGPPQRIFT